MKSLPAVTKETPQKLRNPFHKCFRFSQIRQAAWNRPCSELSKVPFCFMLSAPLLLTNLLGMVTSPSAIPPRCSTVTARGGAHSMLLTGRRESLLLAGGSLIAALGLPLQPASASYALYKAAGDTMAERKATGDWKPGNDRAILSGIQDDIKAKRPFSKPSKYAGKYCAGQTSGVQPMLENICANIGISKADQSNAQADSLGIMTIGIGTETAEYKRYRALIDQAADAQRLRDQYAR
jgi:hypothetical protein